MVAPLADIRVIDWTHVLAGPACAHFLGQLGAEVIKIEKPGRGDAIRHRGGSDARRASMGMSTAYMTQSAGKKSIAVDVATPRGRAVFDRLLKSADVLVENHRPSTLTRLNLTETDTRAINPRLIHCAMTGYGRGNEMSDVPAYDVNIQAISGLMALTGTQDSGPTRTGAPIVDYATGLSGALGIMAALTARTHTGKGAFVDVSMLETALALMSSTVTDYQLTGNAPQRRGNAANSRSPSSGTFACQTGHLSLGVNEASQFAALAQTLGRADWLAAPAFATPSARDTNRDALGNELSAVLMTRSAAEWEDILMAAGVPCAQLRSLPQALDLAAVTQRNYTTRGPAGFAGLPFEMSGRTNQRTDKPPSPLGHDTRSVLTSLGYDEAEITMLFNAGSVAGAD